MYVLPCLAIITPEPPGVISPSALIWTAVFLAIWAIFCVLTVSAASVGIEITIAATTEVTRTV